MPESDDSSARCIVGASSDAVMNEIGTGRSHKSRGGRDPVRAAANPDVGHHQVRCVSATRRERVVRGGARSDHRVARRRQHLADRSRDEHVVLEEQHPGAREIALRARGAAYVEVLTEDGTVFVCSSHDENGHRRHRSKNEGVGFPPNSGAEPTKAIRSPVISTASSRWSGRPTRVCSSGRTNAYRKAPARVLPDATLARKRTPVARRGVSALS